MDEKDVSIFFDKSASYHVSPVNGVWGNWAGDGMLVCEFFLDHREIPCEIKGEIIEGNMHDKEYIFKYGGSDPAFIREKMCALTMTKESARVIGQWLLNFSDNNFSGENKEGGDDEDFAE